MDTSRVGLGTSDGLSILERLEAKEKASLRHRTAVTMLRRTPVASIAQRLISVRPNGLVPTETYVDTKKDGSLRIGYKFGPDTFWVRVSAARLRRNSPRGEPPRTVALVRDVRRALERKIDRWERQSETVGERIQAGLMALTEGAEHAGTGGAELEQGNA